MLRAVHRALERVNASHAWFLPLALASCGTHPYEPVSSGASGYLSDRAWEIVADFPGSTYVPQAHGLADLAWRKNIDRDVTLAVDSFSREGKPLFAGRARIDWQPDQPTPGPLPGSVGWKARLHSLALPGEVPAGFDPQSSSDDRIRFLPVPPEARHSSPDTGSLAEDGVVRVGALFGQINEPFADTDDGYWSRAAFEQDLSLHGYRVVCESASPVRRTWEKSHEKLRVVVDVAGPDAFPLDGSEDQARKELRELIAQHEVIYLNAHANQSPLAVLSDPLAWEPVQYRLVVLDVCWSYFLYARQALDATAWKDTHLVVTSGRVVTGSVESFAGLLHGIVGEMASGIAESGDRREWLSWIAQMNDTADARAQERAGKVSGEYALPEVYGVSGLWKP